MKTTITKSVKSNDVQTKTIESAPAWVQLSFIKYTVKRGQYVVDDWLNTPSEAYSLGCITGHRVAGELMAWAKLQPHNGNRRFIVQSVLEAAQSLLLQPTETPIDVTRKCKSGAAAMVVWALVDFLLFAADNANCEAYCERAARRDEDYWANDAKREADKRADFVERMKTARAAKRNLRAAINGVVTGGENG